MNVARKKATDFYEDLVFRILDNREAAKWHRANFFDRLTDDQFDRLMDDYEAERDYMPIVVPNLANYSLNADRNVKLAKDEFDYDFFQQLRIIDQVTGRAFVTNKKHMVIKGVVRRQAQTLEKKMSIPDDNRHVDELTGQPTGPSKGSSVSFPELQVLYAQGFESSILELIKYRGGDVTAFQAMNKLVADTGEVSLNMLSRLGTRVKSTQTLGAYLRAMHLQHNL